MPVRHRLIHRLPVMKMPPKGYVLSYLVVVLVLFTVVGARPSQLSVPAMTGPSQGRGLPLKSGALRSFLGTGFPSIGALEPQNQGIGAVAGRYLAAWLIEIISPLQLGEPRRALAGVFPGLLEPQFRPPLRGAWPKPAPQTAPAVGPVAKGDVVVYGKRPKVIVYATNGRDSFWPALGSKPSRNQPIPVSSDQGRNVLGVASSLGKALWKAGIPVAVSTAVNDKQGMIGAYLHSAQSVKKLMAKYPSASVLVDVDRSPTPVTPMSAHGTSYARVYLVVGTSSRLPNPQWKDNLAFAKRLGAALQFVQPGILAAVVPSPNRLNQELSPQAVTVHIGGDDSTLAEVQASPHPVALAIAQVVTPSGKPPGATVPLSVPPPPNGPPAPSGSPSSASAGPTH